MTTMFEQAYRCPECGTIFQGQAIGSCGHADKWSDLCPDFWGANPRSLFVSCCPACDYCDFADEFGEVPPDAEIQNRSDPGGSALERYSKAYEHALKKKKSPRALADYAVQVAWCRHDEENQEDSPDFLKARQAAIYYFTEALDAGDVPETEQPAVHYLVAEFSRQNGDFERATEHLDIIENISEWTQPAARLRKHVNVKDAEPYRLSAQEE